MTASKDKIRQSLESMVERIASGEASAEEVSVLPAVLSFYRDCYRAPEVSDVSAPRATPVVECASFPAEGLVAVKQVAAFLALSENSVWQKLRTEADFPKPRLREPRRTRWEAADVREYRRRLDVAYSG
jgi:predicted DNA-binding transcriptional regulator AlpA